MEGAEDRPGDLAKMASDIEGYADYRVPGGVVREEWRETEATYAGHMNRLHKHIEHNGLQRSASEAVPEIIHKRNALPQGLSHTQGAANTSTYDCTCALT